VPTILPLAMARDSNDASTSASAFLDGLVFALVSQTGRVAPTSINAWSNFAVAHKGKVVLAKDLRKDQRFSEDSRVTHVVLVDKFSSHPHIEACIADLPPACRAYSTFPAPTVIRENWFVQSIGQSAEGKGVLPFTDFEYARHPSEGEIAAENAGARTNVSGEQTETQTEAPAEIPYGTSAACLQHELLIARHSLEKWKRRNARSVLTETDFAEFAHQGFPSLVGQTHVGTRLLDAELFGDYSDADEGDDADVYHETHVKRRKLSTPNSSASRHTRRRKATAEAEAEAEANTKQTRLLDLPDDVLRKCVVDLSMLNTLAVAATCLRLQNVALGVKNVRRLTGNAVIGNATHEWPGRTSQPPRLQSIRVMTWNLKNNDPDPSKRFVSQPGAGEANEGWHWHARVPIVARVVQREKPHVLCLQEDSHCMNRELMCAREMLGNCASVQYACYPSPVLDSRTTSGDSRTLNGKAGTTHSTLLEAI
jgi:hypothetical protein